MKYSLRHMPRRGEETVRNGIMFGPNLGSGVLRMHLNSGNPNFDMSSFLFVNGSDPKFWVKESNDSSVRPISLLDSLKPLVEGMNQTAFDLLMPFVFGMENMKDQGKLLVGQLMYFPLIALHGLKSNTRVGKKLL